MLKINTFLFNQAIQNQINSVELVSSILYKHCEEHLSFFSDYSTNSFKANI